MDGGPLGVLFLMLGVVEVRGHLHLLLCLSLLTLELVKRFSLSHHPFHKDEQDTSRVLLSVPSG